MYTLLMHEIDTVGFCGKAILQRPQSYSIYHHLYQLFMFILTEDSNAVNIQRGQD
jgi:hypothetical protein